MFPLVSTVSTATAEHGEELQQRLAQNRLIRRLRGLRESQEKQNNK